MLTFKFPYRLYITKIGIYTDLQQCICRFDKKWDFGVVILSSFDILSELTSFVCNINLIKIEQRQETQTELSEFDPVSRQC